LLGIFLAVKASVKKLVFAHYPSVEVNGEATLNRYQLFYDGEVVFGRDLLKIEP
jgi:hypothetical protein